VYRAYDTVDAPAGNTSRFALEVAARRDPGNTGAYAVDGGTLVIHFPLSNPPERLAVPVPASGQMTIDSVLYARL
jgi:hypothetical protein